MRRLFADRLALFTAAIVIAMSALFAFSRVSGQEHPSSTAEGQMSAPP
jgi:hypothetical protein